MRQLAGQEEVLSFGDDDITKRWEERSRFEKASPGAADPISTGPKLPRKGGKSGPLAGGLMVLLLVGGAIYYSQYHRDGAGTPPTVAPVPAPAADLAELTKRPPVEVFELARQLAQSGEVDKALVLWEAAAQRRHGPSARAVAEMYDPSLWHRVPTAFSQPNLNSARRWYARAVEYGDADARARLAQLDSWAKAQEASSSSDMQ